MKMTKIAFWRATLINCNTKAKKPFCGSESCGNCPYEGSHSCLLNDDNNDIFNKRKEMKKLAEAYIKRHEQKSKKRIIPKYTADVQPDTTGSELKKIVMKPANPDPTPLEIAKMIRDNGYVINCKDFSPNLACGSCTTDFCDHILSKEKARASIKKIDDYISSHEKIEPACEHLVGDLCGNAFETCDKECLANSEILKPEPVIEPIKFQLPKIAFVVFADGIGVRSKNFTIDSDGNLTHSGCLCYDNIDKAVAVAKKNWGLE